ncbi:MAG: hypothetical protein AAB906_04770 [Patescibacteria group bacterium]
MKNFKNQAAVITISVVIFISFLSLIYKSGSFDGDEKEDEAPIDIASEINDKIEERKESILEEKTEELANRIRDLLNFKEEEDDDDQIPTKKTAQQTQTKQTQAQTQTQQPAADPAPKPRTKVS